MSEPILYILCVIRLGEVHVRSMHRHESWAQHAIENEPLNRWVIVGMSASAFVSVQYATGGRIGGVRFEDKLTYVR